MRLRRTLLAALGFVTFTPLASAAEPLVKPADELPPPPTVSDPMLAPVPQARRLLRTWEEALVLVKSRSIELRSALADVSKAEAQWRTALAGALPNISGNASLTHQPINTSLFSAATSGNNTANANLTLIQPLLATRAWYAIGTADQAIDVARLNVEDAKRLIALRVANGMVAVVTAERIAELNRLGLRSALERLELTQRKATLGAATGLDVVRARQDVEATRGNLVTGDESLRQAREALGLALGVAEPVGVPPEVRIDGLESAAVAACKPAPRIEDRPDVASAQAGIALAERGQGDATRQFVPIIDFRSSLSSTAVDREGLPVQNTWNIQAVLTVPIWDGGARYGALRSAAADQERAALRQESLRRTATIEVAQARRGVDVASQARAVASQSRDLAVETDRLVRRAYQEGRGTSLELVTAANTLRQSDINLALREFDLVKARVLAVLSLATCPY